MTIKDIKIGSQLKLGFVTVLFFVVVIGLTSYFQTNLMHNVSETIYQHPMQVRTAIGYLKFDIQSALVGVRDLLLAESNDEKLEALQHIEIADADALRQLEIIKEQYLGPKADIEEVYTAFVEWKTIRTTNTTLALQGKIENMKDQIKPTGAIGIARIKLHRCIHKIDSFANAKADELTRNSQKINHSLRMQLLLLVVFILFFSLIIVYYLYRNIRKPLIELTEATQRFHEGELQARSAYPLHNEFGALSNSFNQLADRIQTNMELNRKVSDISAIMLGEDNAKRFFLSTLNAIALHTGTQMAAVYLLSEDKKRFEHFESIGIDRNAKQSFAKDDYEGEFGIVLSSRKVQHIKNIQSDPPFVFHTVSGMFIPREILTIPIHSGEEVVAIISLASVNPIQPHAVKLMENLLDTLSARIVGILAYQKIQDFSKKLEHQNRELEAQKNELASQSTELMEQNTELEAQKRVLDEANRLKTSFLSNMSHELRTPLNSVIALSGVLSRRLTKKIPEEEYSYLAVIERNGLHLLALINDILDLSRVEAGREEIESSQFSVNSLIEEILTMMKPQLGTKPIQLINSSADKSIMIRSDLHKCRHILQNLVDNALKFTETGKVELSAALTHNEIKIIVQDTGIGISEDNLPHIFDEFRQADSSTSRRFGGTGLGLAIVNKYATLLGGNIFVKSVEGSGSEFTLTLPIEFVSGNSRLQVSDHNGKEVGHNKDQFSSNIFLNFQAKTILLVDDSQPAIIQIKDFLDESGHNILTAKGGAEALKIIDQVIPDAIILDLMMPGIDGFEVLRIIREAERTAHIPVLILTAKHITKEELNFLSRNNVHQLIQKGDIKRDELLNAIVSMITSQSVESKKNKPELQKITGKPVVLVVEDNPDNMIAVKAILADEYIVIEAKDGNEGIELAKREKLNLILMDIALPILDGIQSFKTIRSLPQLNNVPIIALTASAMTEERETILAYGFDAYIAKPIDQRIFFKTINEILYGA